MNKQDSPVGAKEWSEFLTAQILPTGPFVGKQVLKTIKEDKLPYKKIAERVNKDPIFSYHVMSKANQGKGESAPFSKTLDHAISMLGTESLKKITLSLPTISPKPGDSEQFYYARVICSSLLASYLARSFSAIKQLGQTEDIYWGALFCGVPMWYLWRFATPQMKQVRHTIHTDYKSPKEAETEVFGCTIPELAQTLVNRLDVPPLTKACYAPESQLTPKQWIKMSRHVRPSGRPIKVDDKRINLVSSRASFAITLANLLAYYASQDWYSTATLRVQKVIAVYLGIPLDQAIAITHKCAADMSREHPIPDILLPAARLMLPPRDKAKKESLPQQSKPLVDQPNETSSSATPLTTATTAASAVATKTEPPSVTTPAVSPTTTEANQSEKEPDKPINEEPAKPAEIKVNHAPKKEEVTQEDKAPQRTRGDKDTFNEFTDLMLNNPDNFVDLHELMNAATQCVSYGIGLQKAIVALVNTGETRLKAYYHVGTRDHPQLSGYQADLTKPSLFSRLIEKPSSIWVKPSSNKNIWAMIPPEFKVASAAKEFFLMSIFVNQKPVAVFYADSGDESHPLTEYDYKQFKYMCSAATHCLQYLAAKRAKQT
ncbi:HDOD domain-containing protein [Alkalimarinus sediminis]|uniref:HDOD domain-containing protein n=1 Tax=Alkalimarinus sediminis TaxID=1632866 RepID=A0A9E8KPE8_9ALTE|nr:HDOD domain-containing protein [Alkalimarinus sediminis]UZW74105.1 HDOD domain-containing protein [Alkalimarinus sediminis]